MPLAAAHLALEATYGGAMSAHSLRMLAAVAAVAVAAAAGAFYGNASHVDVLPLTHNGGAGLWPRQRIAAAAASVADGAARALTLRGGAVRYDLPMEVEAIDGRHLAASVPLLVLALAGLAALARQLPAWRRVLRGDAAPEPSALPSCLTLALLALFPSSGVLRHGYDNAGADRYSYFAAMLMVLPVAEALKAAMQVQPVGKASPGWLRRGIVAAVAAAVVAAALISARGCEAWRDPIAFGWAELGAAHTPAAQAAAANDLGLRLHGAGRHAEALELLTGPAGLGAAAPTHLSMALTASACAAVLGQHARGLDALAPALREHGEREGALHVNAAVLAAGACRAGDALRHVRAAAALSLTAQTSLERRVSATLSRCVRGVVITWPVAAASGWGTLSRALLRALMDAGVAPMLLHAPTATRHMLDAFSEAEMRGLQAAHEELIRMIAVDGFGMADGHDPAACAVQELPLAVLHGLGNGLRGSDVVASGGGCLRLTGLVANVALLFFEDTSGLAPERLAHFTALVAGSSWTRDVLLAVQPPPRVVLALQGVDGAVFATRQAQPQLVDGAFRVFSGGKLEYRKGQDVVIAAFKRLLAACPGAVLVAAWHTDYPELAQGLKLAGHVTELPVGSLGEAEMLGWLAANGVPHTAVRLLGAVDAHAVAAAMADCHVAIFPSRAESGTNLFAAQALASGVPSVLTGGTGHADLVDAFADLCWVMRRGAEVRDAARRGWVEPDVDEAAEMLLQAWVAAKRGLDAEAIAEAARRGAERMTWRGWFANASVAWGA